MTAVRRRERGGQRRAGTSKHTYTRRRHFRACRGLGPFAQLHGDLVPAVIVAILAGDRSTARAAVRHERAQRNGQHACVSAMPHPSMSLRALATSDTSLSSAVVTKVCGTESVTSATARCRARYLGCGSRLAVRPEHTPALAKRSTDGNGHVRQPALLQTRRRVVLGDRCSHLLQLRPELLRRSDARLRVMY